jgi:hypothetical protein
MRLTTIIAFILVLIGAITWLLVGLTGFNLVTFITMDTSLVERIIYVLVGLSGLWMIFYSFMYKPFNEAK